MLLPGDCPCSGVRLRRRGEERLPGGEAPSHRRCRKVQACPHPVLDGSGKRTAHDIVTPRMPSARNSPMSACSVPSAQVADEGLPLRDLMRVHGPFRQPWRGWWCSVNPAASSHRIAAEIRRPQVGQIQAIRLTHRVWMRVMVHRAAVRCPARGRLGTGSDSTRAKDRRRVLRCEGGLGGLPTAPLKSEDHHTPAHDVTFSAPPRTLGWV